MPSGMAPPSIYDKLPSNNSIDDIPEMPIKEMPSLEDFTSPMRPVKNQPNLHAKKPSAGKPIEE